MLMAWLGDAIDLRLFGHRISNKALLYFTGSAMVLFYSSSVFM